MLCGCVNVCAGRAIRAVLIVDGPYVRERTRAAVRGPSYAAPKIGMVAHMRSRVGVTLAKLVWVDKDGVNDEYFLGDVTATGFEMHYKQDNQQVYQALGKQVVTAVKGRV